MKVTFRIKKNTITSFSLVFWLFVSMNSFFVWFLSGFALGLLSLLMVYASTVFLYRANRLIISRRRLFLTVCIFIFSLYLLLFSRGGSVYSFIKYIPLMFVVFWDADTFDRSYLLFRKCILFFSVLAILVTVVSFFGFYQYIPYVEIDGMSAVHINQDFSLRVHGLVVTIPQVTYDFGSFFLVRACGPLQEPGHFAIFLGIVLALDAYLLKKINAIIIVCGIITFSPFFLIILLLVLFYYFYSGSSRKALNFVLWFSILLASSIMILKQNDLIDAVWGVAVERNLGIITDNSDGNVIEQILDKRIPHHNLLTYKQYIKTSSVWLGAEDPDSTFVLSDFRGFIFFHGIVGFVLLSSVFFALLYSFKASRSVVILLIIPIILLTFLHRSWMFASPYIFTLLYIGMQSHFSLKRSFDNSV